jgi:hypothetical protein
MVVSEMSSGSLIVNDSMQKFYISVWNDNFASILVKKKKII